MATTVAPVTARADSQSKDAVQTAARALYFQQHWDQDVNRYLSHYERMFTPEQKKWGGYAYWVARVYIDQQVTFRWTF